jgi:hypothetical protein
VKEGYRKGTINVPQWVKPAGSSDRQITNFNFAMKIPCFKKNKGTVVFWRETPGRRAKIAAGRA